MDPNKYFSDYNLRNFREVVDGEGVAVKMLEVGGGGVIKGSF